MGKPVQEESKGKGAGVGSVSPVPPYPPKETREAMREALSAQHSPVVIQETLKLTPKTYYDLLGKEVLKPEQTYAEAMLAVVEHYRRMRELRAEELELKKKRQVVDTVPGKSTGDYMHPVIRAEKLQNIRLALAREEELHLKNAQTKGQLVNVQTLARLFEPFVLNIKAILVQAGQARPELGKEVGKCLLDLASMGAVMEREALQAEQAYVREQMERPIELDEEGAYD